MVMYDLTDFTYLSIDSNVLNMLDVVSSEAQFYEWNILYISPLTKRLL